MILAKPLAVSAPTRRDGLSGRIRLGKRASIAALRWRSASYSASVISGASSVLYSRSWWAISAASRSSSAAASSSVSSSGRPVGHWPRQLRRKAASSSLIGWFTTRSGISQITSFGGVSWNAGLRK